MNIMEVEGDLHPAVLLVTVELLFHVAGVASIFCSSMFRFHSKFQSNIMTAYQIAFLRPQSTLCGRLSFSENEDIGSHKGTFEKNQLQV